MKIIVTLIGVAAIAGVNYWFFLSRGSKNDR